MRPSHCLAPALKVVCALEASRPFRFSRTCSRAAARAGVAAGKMRIAHKQTAIIDTKGPVQFLNRGIARDLLRDTNVVNLFPAPETHQELHYSLKPVIEYQLPVADVFHKSVEEQRRQIAVARVAPVGQFLQQNRANRE